MISPTNTISPEWGNENALRSYPIEDDAPAADMIPKWVIADVHVTVSSEYSTIFVSSVYVSDTIISVGISGVDTDGKSCGLLTKTVTRDELEPYATYSMDRISELAAGSIALGEPPFGTQPFKRTFTHEEAPIVASAITRITPSKVMLLKDDDHDASADGIIDLSGNSEFRTYVDPDDATGQTIVIELTDMYRDMTTSVCNSEPSFDECGRTPVKTVSGVGPDDDGVLTLRFK